VTGYGLEDRGSISLGRGKELFSSLPLKTGSGVSRLINKGIERPDPKSDHSHASISEEQNKRRFTYSLSPLPQPICLRVLVLRLWSGCLRVTSILVWRQWHWYRNCSQTLYLVLCNKWPIVFVFTWKILVASSPNIETGFWQHTTPLLLLLVTSLWHTTYTEFPRKREHILNICDDKMKRARRLQFSSHDNSYSGNIFCTFLHFTALRPGLLLLLAKCQSVFKCPETDACAQSYVRDKTSIVSKISTVPLSCGEIRTLLSLFIFSIKRLNFIHSVSDTLYFGSSHCSQSAAI
jgi:hypothetical protein